MSVFHFKAELQETKAEGIYIYRFYPDYVMAGDVSGRFTVSNSSWDYEIIEPTDAEERELVASDQMCVLRLISKIKTLFESNGEMPQELFRIS